MAAVALDVPVATKVQLVSAFLVVALPLAAVAVAIVIFWSHGIGWRTSAWVSPCTW
jgi:hypothetical protein